MKRWRIRLLFFLAPIALLLIAGGALLLQPSGQAQAAVGTGDSISCSAASAPVDALVVAPDSAGTSLGSTTDSPALSATCYFVGITKFNGACGNQDLYVLRYLCYSPTKGWYYVNYAYCA
ncbi:MAG: hypothetical protein Q8P22_04920 [Chloroflexota bacterium]|nr:hypothetical protein [Chloroflexota bacterium]